MPGRAALRRAPAAFSVVRSLRLRIVRVEKIDPLREPARAHRAGPSGSGPPLACGVLTPAAVYLRAAIAECREIEEAIAHIYEELGAMHARDQEMARLWNSLALDERRQGRVLAALLAATDAEQDDGPFLVDVRERLARVRRTVDRIYRRVREGVGPDEALDLAAFIEGSDLPDVLDEVVELALPAVLDLVGMTEKELDGANDHRARIEEARRKIQQHQA
jgi:hypothetical protein